MGWYPCSWWFLGFLTFNFLYVVIVDLVAKGLGSVGVVFGGEGWVCVSLFIGGWLVTRLGIEFPMFWCVSVTLWRGR